MAGKKISIIIMGAGEVGKGLARGLSAQGHSITVIDPNAAILSDLEAHADICTVIGSGSDLDALKEAKVANAELFIAVSSSDEHNLLACAAAKHYGVHKTIARLRTDDFLNADPTCYQEALKIDMVINPDEVAAQELFDIILNPVISSVKDFAKGKVKLIGVKLHRDAPICNKALKDIPELDPSRAMLVASVVRGEQVIIPRGEFVLQEGDLVYFIAGADFIAFINQLGSAQHQGVDKVVFVGAGRVSRFLAEKMEATGIRLLVIESDKKKCEQFATELNSVTMLNGDGTDIALLKEAGVSEADAVVSLSRDDENNILSCLLAKEQGTKRVIVLISKPQYMPLLEHIRPIDVAVNPRVSTIHSIIRYIRQGEAVSMTLFADDKAEAVEVIVSEGSPLAGKKIKEMNIPKNVLLGAVLRGDEVFIPKGENELRANDRVIVIGLKETVEKIDSIISSPDTPTSLKQVFSVISNTLTGNGK